LKRIAVTTSLLLSVATLICWYHSVRPGGHGFDLVRWQGNEEGYVSYGFACHSWNGSAEVQWVRMRGGFAETGQVDETAPVGQSQPNASYMPGVGDSRAENGGPPGRWNWTDHVWDFNIREDHLVDAGEPLVATRWGLNVDVRKAAWELPWKGGIIWQRVSFRRMCVPFWLIALTFSLPGVVQWVIWGWRRARHRARSRSGICTACGYDLQATPDRCPECGAIPGSATVAA
jgi:hypothetical protein